MDGTRSWSHKVPCGTAKKCPGKPLFALVTFHKRVLPGLFPGCIWPFFCRPARNPGGPQPGAVHFSPPPGGPRVTFNSNLKVTRAPARNIPRFKPVICPAGARQGPCRDSPGTRGRMGPGWVFRRRLYDVRAGAGRDLCQDLCIISRGIHSY